MIRHSLHCYVHDELEIIYIYFRCVLTCRLHLASRNRSSAMHGASASQHQIHFHVDCTALRACIYPVWSLRHAAIPALLQHNRPLPIVHPFQAIHTISPVRWRTERAHKHIIIIIAVQIIFIYILSLRRDMFFVWNRLHVCGQKHYVELAP